MLLLFVPPGVKTLYASGVMPAKAITKPTLSWVRRDSPRPSRLRAGRGHHARGEDAPSS